MLQFSLVCQVCGTQIGQEHCRYLSLHEYQSIQLLEDAGVLTPKGGVAETPQQAYEIAEIIGKSHFQMLDKTVKYVRFYKFLFEVVNSWCLVPTRSSSTQWRINSEFLLFAGHWLIHSDIVSDTSEMYVCLHLDGSNGFRD